MSIHDDDLVTRIADGDSAAMGELFDRYARRMLGLIAAVIGRRHDADDVLQESFTSVWRSAASYRRERSSVSTWLLLIARSRAIDHLRRHRRDARTGEHGDSLDAVVRDGDTDSLDESRAAARRAIAELPSEQRDALELAFFRGLTHMEIARAQGVPLGTVKTRIRLALGKLRERVDQPQEITDQ